MIPRLEKALAIIVLITLFCAGLQAAWGQQTPLPCSSHVDLEKQLKAKYDEDMRAAGITAYVQLLRLYVNEETGTWTATLQADPHTPECMTATGQGFKFIAKPPPGEPN